MEEEDRVLQFICEKVLKDISGPVDLYLSKRTRHRLTIPTWVGNIVPPDRFKGKNELWIGFIDMLPGANFEHPVKYVFIDVHSNIYEILDKSTPPNDLYENYKCYPGLIRGKSG